MRRGSVWFIAVSLAGWTFSLLAADAPKAVVEKAIRAQGGEDKVARLKVMRVKVEGEAVVIPGQASSPVTIEDTWQMPSQYRTAMTIQLPVGKVTQVLALDGDKGWGEGNGIVQDLPKEGVAEMKEQKHAEDLDRLQFLKDPQVELSACGEIQVNGAPAVGVQVKSKGHREVKLYFDKKTGLLVKREHRILDSPGQEVLQEVVFSDYQERDGLRHYRKLTAYKDGKKFIEGKVTELEFFDKLDDKVFRKPSGKKD